MTRSEAQNLIDTYCDRTPEQFALERLMSHDLSEFNGLNMPGNDAQDRLDSILYPRFMPSF